MINDFANYSVKYEHTKIMWVVIVYRAKYLKRIFNTKIKFNQTHH
jgi:hypothetical protein